MKILFSIANLKIGGAQIVALRLARKLQELGHRVDIYDHFPDDRNNGMVDNNFPNARLFSVEESRWKRKIIWKINALFQLISPTFSFFQKKNKSRFKSLIKTKKYDIIHSHMFDSDWIVSQTVESMAPNQLVLSMHGCYEERIARFGIDKMKLKIETIFNLFGKISFLTENNLHFLELLSLKHVPKLEKIYNGIDLRGKKLYDNKKRGQNPFIFGLVARGVKEKGWAETIQAAIQLSEKTNFKFEVHLVGDSPFLQGLKNKYQYHKYIHFLGYCNDPTVVMKNFDVGLLPSYTESLPTSIIEYMALGIPVIASNVGEIRNMLIDLKTQHSAGLIIPLKNGKPDISQLQMALAKLISDEKTYNKLKESTKHLILQFDMQKCTDNYIDFYNAK